MNADELEECLIEYTKEPVKERGLTKLLDVLISAQIVDLIKQMHLDHKLYGGELDLAILYSGLKWMQINKEVESYSISELHCVLDVRTNSGTLTRFWYHPSMADSIAGVKNHSDEGY